MSSRIVQGRVTGMQSAWNPGHTQIRTTITINVSDVFKGTMPPNGALVIEQLGGQVGDMAMDVSDQPSFTVGENVILFLGASGIATPVVGLQQGKLTVVPDPSTGVPMVRDRAITRDAFVQKLSRTVLEQQGGR